MVTKEPHRSRLMRFAGSPHPTALADIHGFDGAVRIRLRNLHFSHTAAHAKMGTSFSRRTGVEIMLRERKPFAEASFSK